MVNRLHHCMKEAPWARMTDASWFDQLLLVMLGIRLVVKEDLGVSLAQLVYGTNLRLPGCFFEPAGHHEAEGLCQPKVAQW